MDHDWLYNFPSIPDKRICERCKKRESMTFKTLEWDSTFNDPRSDEELINRWTKNNNQ